MAKEALARVRPSEDDAERSQPAQADEVLVHVRFHPNAEISSIGEKPENLSAGAWFKHLLNTASPHYQVLAGGRGFFRIPRSSFETILRDVRG
jgi:hypothetical protein